LTVELVVLPSPNVHFQEVGVFVEVSVNVTVNGAVPDRGVAEKFATGATTGAVTVM
jgi:hypothetical protein